MSQRRLGTPEDLIRYQLRSALTMEQHSLEALDELHTAARDKKVKKLFSHHADETREQIANLERVFELLGVKRTSAPSPATTGIKNQASSLLEKAEPKLHNQIAVMSALGNEHFEISAYSGLMMQADALGMNDAVELLQDNLDQEVHTSEELQSTLQDLVS